MLEKRPFDACLPLRFIRSCGHTALNGRYGVKEHKVDTLLRNGVFIDLYNIVRNGVLIGEPNYSIKSVEHLYANKRQTEVVGGGESVVLYEEWRSNPDGKTWQTSPMLKAIRDYNIDDCNSTQQLAEWLRSKQDAHKIEYLGSSSEDIEQQDDDESQITLLRDQILQRADTEADKNIKDIIRTLAWLLDFHQRENKPTWWRLFDRLGLTEIDLYDDMDCLVGLQRTDLHPFLPTPRSKNKVFEYAFDPNQPFKGQTRSFYILGEDKTKVTAVDIDQDKGLIKLQSKIEPDVQLSLLPDDFVRPAPIPEAIQSVIEKLLANNFAPSAITDFLFRRKPRFVDGPKKQIVPSLLTGEPLINSIVAAVNSLDRSYLCIQGPPGAGKTYTAQHIIGNLLSKGKRIGISSNSHKAIINLMAGVADHLLKENITGQLIKVGGDSDDTIFNKPNVIFKKNVQACGGELNAPALCMGGTAWLFCNPNLTEEQGITIFDYLFIDEAGQVSIANLVGMSRIAKNIILMGDQMQLGQPSQGSHPEDSGLSILEYLLKDQATIPVDMGVFLPKTYRMHTTFVA